MSDSRNAPLLARLQKQRRVVIPQEVIEHLGVDEGEYILFRLQGRNKGVVIAAEIGEKKG